MTGDAFDAFKRGGFNVFSDPKEATAEMTADQLAVFNEELDREYHLNSAIHRALSTPDGLILLQFMHDVALGGQRFDIATETDALLAAAKGFFREGQAAFYFECTKRITRAMEGPPVTQPTTEDEGN